MNRTGVAPLSPQNPMVCGAITGNWLMICPAQVRPTAAAPARSTVDGVRLGLRPAGRSAQGDRPKGSAAQRAGLPSFGLQRLGLHRGADPGGKAFAIITVLPTL